MKRLLLYAFVLMLAIVGCKKGSKIDEQPVNPGDTTGTTNNTLKIHIDVPAGSPFNPSGGKVLSSFRYADIDSKSDANAFIDTGTVTIAYVFNKDNQLMLAGFITDSSRVISPATTAKVLLHWGLRFPFQPYGITKSYINSIDRLQHATEWVAKFESLFKADPLVVSKGAFKNDLKDAIEKIRDKRTLDINAKKASDIKADANDIRSGLQILEDGLSQLSINNYYRRRSYAYLYKMSYKDVNDVSHQVLGNITEGSSPDKEQAVDPLSGITSVLGEVGKYVEDASQSSFVVKSGPVDLSLGDNENEVAYKIRIVGPGAGSAFVTTIENDKLNALQLETFLFDVVIPGMATLTSAKGLGDKADLDESVKAKAITLLKGQLKNMPDVYEEIKKGNYENAFMKFLENLYKDGTGEFLNLTCTMLGEIYKIDPKELTAGGFSKVSGILSVFDFVLGTSDLYKILANILASKQMEEWDVLARSSQVRLTPDETATIPSSQEKITATIKNLGETGDTHPFFEWKTSGKYGYLIDTKGHKGTSFESQDAQVNYNCNATAASLSDGDNWEYIYVKATYAGKVIGTDTAKVNVRKLAYKMTPNNITLSGKKGNNNEVRLYLIRQDNVSDIKPNNLLDYKIVWSTPGAHGKLANLAAEGKNTITTYDDNSMWYTCTDDETKETKETVTARIYVKSKDEADYHLLDEVTGTIKISNDEKKRIIQVSLTYLKGAWKEGNWYCYPVAVFPVDDSAKKYSVMFYNYSGTSKNPPEGTTYTWNAGKAPPTYYSTFSETLDISGGNYYICTGRTWCSGAPGGGCNAAAADGYEARYKELYGTGVKAEVTFYY